ncbi:MAG: choice-of-anchor D domain-containing protein [Firmicutes bacterium]|nr:choice-of-anchor D domain-containing protein [Bacillota bacterium]
MTGQSVSSAGWLTISGEDITDFVKAQIADGYASLLITGSTTADTDFGINTKESTANQPVLCIEYTSPSYTIANIADQTLDEVTEGYAAGSQETKTVTVTRTGTGDLLNLATELTAGDASDFEISQPAVTTLNDGTPSTTFTVKAKDGLAAGTYSATITVSADDMSDETFTVTQVVNESGGALTYTIANIADQTLDEVTEGYAAGSQETKTVTITRTGTGDLLNLATELTAGDTSDFEISQPAVTTLNDGAPSTTFTVKAKDGLAAGTYSATVTVLATSMSDETFTVTQAVYESGGALTYTIVNIADQTLDELTEGYAAGSQETKTVTVTRTGTGDLLNLATELTAGDTSDFEISQPAVTTLNDGTPSTTFTVKAKDGLATGTYSATVTVLATSMSDETFTVTQAVYESGGALTYTIVNIADQTLDELTEGYAAGSQETKTVTITRTGTGDLLNLATELTAGDTSDFEISQPAVTTLNDGTPSTTFTVKAKDGLAAGTYSATITVSADDMSDETFTVTQVVNAAGDTVISTAAIAGVTAPVKGAAPVDTIAAIDEYTATISWSPADATFAPSTVYTATITITPKAGYTLTGVAENFFTVAGATATNPANSGVVTAVFPATAAGDTVISTAAIAGVTAPVKGAAPVDTIAATDEYTATISWSPADATFAPSTVYTATITITPKAGYTLTGVAENFFTVAGATATNPANSGVVTAVFPATSAPDKYTVTFNVNGGSAVAAINDVVSGSTITAPANPTRSGYQFAGWYKNAGLTIAWNFATDTVTSNITLYAKWTATYELTVPDFSIAPQSILNGSSKQITLAASGSKLIIDGVEQAAVITYTYAEVEDSSNLATLTGANLTLIPPAGSTGKTVKIKATATWTEGDISLNASRVAAFTVTNQGAPPCTCVVSTPVFSIDNQTIPYNVNKTLTLAASGAKLAGGCNAAGHAGSEISYSYAIVSGNLDSNGASIASIDSSTLTLNPTIAGTYSVTVQATAAANGKTASKTVSFTVTKEPAPPAASCICSITTPSLAGTSITIASGTTDAMLDLSGKLTPGTLAGGCMVDGHSAAVVNHVYTIKSGYNTAGASLNGKTLTVTRAGSVTVTVTATANGKISTGAEATYTVTNADVSAVEDQIAALPVAGSDTPSDDDTEINDASAAILAAKTDFENLTVEEKEQISTVKRNKLDTLINRLGLLQTSTDDSKAGGTVTAAGLETAVNTTGDLAAGNSVNITLTVEAEGNISQDSEVETDSNIILASAGSGQTLSSAFDIRLIKTVTEATGSITTEPIAEADAPIYVTMEVPAGMRGGTDYIIYHVHTLADGSKELETIAATYNANSNPPTISFWISEFSTIIIAFTPSADNPSDGGGESSSVSSDKTAIQSGTEVNILVNGKAEPAGTLTTATRGTQAVNTITVDPQKLEQRLEQEGNNPVVTIPFTASADVAVAELNGQTVKNLESREAVVEVKTEAASYTLPAQQIDIDTIAEQIGKGVELKDIRVQIEISQSTAQTVTVVENSANTGEFTIVAPPVEFNVRCTSSDKTVKVSSFNAYVERTIAIPAGVDPNKITTGVIIDPDSAARHVPTKIVLIDGKYHARINSLTDSTYSVIYNSKTFKDVANHWSKEAVNDMGSRLVISGVSKDTFEPDRDITRAEFAAIVIRALGLKPGAGKSPFSDVTDNAWYCGYVKTAGEYKIISGYGNGSFGPMDRITREQAAAMIARAMKITRLKAELNAEESEKLIAGFADASQAAEWARESIAACVKAGIVSGRGGSRVAPLDNITRAETAVMVRGLLQKSSLI